MIRRPTQSTLIRLEKRLDLFQWKEKSKGIEKFSDLQARKLGTETLRKGLPCTMTPINAILGQTRLSGLSGLSAMRSTVASRGSVIRLAVRSSTITGEKANGKWKAPNSATKLRIGRSDRRNVR